jgi:hypothetical protein
VKTKIIKIEKNIKNDENTMMSKMNQTQTTTLSKKILINSTSNITFLKI